MATASTSRPSLKELEAKAKAVRRDIITSTTTAGSGHPTSSLSGVEIAVALYFGGLMRYDPKNPTWPQRDRFILSKGHAAPLLYAVLAALHKAAQTKGRPSVIVARTVKGYPIQKLLTSDPNHHGKPLTAEEAKKALEVIGA